MTQDEDYPILEGKEANFLLKFILPQNNGKSYFINPPGSWRQNFHFIDYKLVQDAPGPCGLFAVLHAYMATTYKISPDLSAEDLLKAAILNIMYKLRQTFAFCCDYKLGSNNAIDAKDSSLQFYVTKSQESALSFLTDNQYLSDDEALIKLVISFVFLVGPNLLNSYAFPEPFITAEHLTDARFVYLLLTGKAVDIPLDDLVIVGGIIHAGVTEEQQVGFLKFDDNRSLERVGDYFKFPSGQTWVVFSGHHFTTISREKGRLYEYDSLDPSPETFRFINSNHPLYDELQEIGELFDQQLRMS